MLGTVKWDEQLATQSVVGPTAAVQPQKSSTQTRGGHHGKPGSRAQHHHSGTQEMAPELTWSCEIMIQRGISVTKKSYKNVFQCGVALFYPPIHWEHWPLDLSNCSSTSRHLWQGWQIWFNPTFPPSSGDRQILQPPLFSYTQSCPQTLRSFLSPWEQR